MAPAPGIVERDAGGFITRITLANQNLGLKRLAGLISAFTTRGQRSGDLHFADSSNLPG